MLRTRRYLEHSPHLQLGTNQERSSGYKLSALSRQIYAAPDLSCIVTWRLVESVGRVFDPVVSSAIAVIEQMWCVDWLLTATVYTKLWSCCESSLDAAVSRRDSPQPS